MITMFGGGRLRANGGVRIIDQALAAIATTAATTDAPLLRHLEMNRGTCR